MAPSGTTVFEYLDYKKYVVAALAARPGGGRGERSRLAEALGCHTAYVSLVLKGEAHFSLEQAAVVTRHLGLGEEESHFFLLLVQLARAGTKELRRYFETQLRSALDRRAVLKNRLEYQKTLSREDQATYYSAWYYAAIHVLVSIPELSTREAIARRLALPARKVAQVLQFLEDAGLVTQEGGRYKLGTARIHLESDSPMISKHHANWRVRALASLDRDDPEQLHYSSIVTLSRADIPKVRETLVRAIEEVRSTVRASGEEELFCYAIDAFIA